MNSADYQLMAARANGETLLGLRLAVRADESLNTVEREEVDAAMNKRFAKLNHEALKHQKPRWVAIRHGQ